MVVFQLPTSILHAKNEALRGKIFRLREEVMAFQSLANSA